MAITMTMPSGGVRTGAGGSERRDEEIIGEVLRGNTALFELLMRRHNERVYRTARAILRDEQEAEDVMQQAYVNAFTHLRQFNGQAQFSTWLTRITVNESLARLRRRSRLRALDDQTDSDAAPLARDNPEHEAFTGELRVLLERAIGRLPLGLRTVFVLREVEGLSTAETAASLGLSADAVKTRLLRSRRALRRMLRERIGATATGAFRFERPRCDRVVTRVLGTVRPDQI